MGNLHKKKCIPCDGGVPKLKSRAAKEFQKQTPDWRIIKNHHISRDFKFKDFKTALNFVNKVGAIAEKENHHPNIDFTWGQVIISIYTHAIDGLHSNDFILAAKIDRLLKKNL